MITFFTIPKPFTNPHISIIQKNAIKSWISINAQKEIFLCGNDYGVKEVAQKLNIKHLPNIETNKFNTPLLNSAFKEACKIAQSNIICYINCDIIILSNFLNCLRDIAKFSEFLIVGRRIDLDIAYPIKFNENWELDIKEKIKNCGQLHGYSGIDYFIFPKNIKIKMKKFAVGRPGWDNWFLFESRKKRIPVIDATQVATTIHQNHDYSHHKKGGKGILFGSEARQNFKLADNLGALMNIMGANLILTKNGFRRPAIKKMLYSGILLFYPTRKLFSLKRKIQKMLLKLS